MSAVRGRLVLRNTVSKGSHSQAEHQRADQAEPSAQVHHRRCLHLGRCQSCSRGRCRPLTGDDLNLRPLLVAREPLAADCLERAWCGNKNRGQAWVSSHGPARPRPPHNHPIKRERAWLGRRRHHLPSSQHRPNSRCSNTSSSTAPQLLHSES